MKKFCDRSDHPSAHSSSHGLGWLLPWHLGSSQTELLRRLDDHLLLDIGVDPADIGKPAHTSAQRWAQLRLKLLM